MAVVRVFGKHAGTWTRSRKASRTHRKNKKRKKTVIHNNDNAGLQFHGGNQSPSGGEGGIENASNHVVVHPTTVRANLPFKRRVNEVKRAATKAKRAAKSTLSRPNKKSKRPEIVPRRTPPTAGVSPKKRHEKRGKSADPPQTGKRTETAIPVSESDQSFVPPVDTAATFTNGKTTVHTAVAAAIPSTSAAKPKQKDSLSSRFSIISFKAFKPKSLSPDKYKIAIIDKRQAKSADKRSKSKSKKAPDSRNRSPDKVKREHETKVVSAAEVAEKSRRNRSPSKRATMEDDRKKSRHSKAVSSRSPDKSRRLTLPNNTEINKYRLKAFDKQKHAPNESNWLIQKFLADEQRIAKPLADGSLRGSVTSMNALINGSCNGSPVLSHTRHGSTRALLPEAAMGSPVRGVVNEAFVSSPRGARTHSSLRVTKSVSPDEDDVNFCSSNKYRRSISMEAYNQGQASPDKRKRPKRDEGASPDKRRRFSSPEKNHGKPVVAPRRYEFGENMQPPRSSTSPLSSRAGSSHSTGGSSPPSTSESSHSTSGERGGARGKLSVVTATTGGSVVSIMEPTEILETASLHSSGKGVLDSTSLHSNGKLMLETASINSSGKGGLDTNSLHSNCRDGLDAVSLHSSNKGNPDTSSLHSSGKCLLETSSQNSREIVAEGKICSKTPKHYV